MLNTIDNVRGDVPRSKFVSKLLRRALNEDQNAIIKEFLVDWKKGVKGILHISNEDIQGYLNKMDYEDHVIRPLLRKLSIGENDSELSKSLKYPGEY
jgi:hypothetical protein